MRTQSSIEAMVVAVGLMTLGAVAGMLLPVEAMPEEEEGRPAVLEIREIESRTEGTRHRIRSTVDLLMASLPSDLRRGGTDFDPGAE